MASLKALLVSAGAVSIAVVALGATAPSISGPLGPKLPPALGWFLSLCRPPCPFVIINVIIAAIAATSRCVHRAQPERITITVVEEMEVMEATPADEAEAFDESKDFEEKRVVVVAAGNGGGSSGVDGYNGDCEGERKVTFGRSMSARRRRVDSSEKALVPPRLVRQKAAGGDHPQGAKALRRSKENMEHVLKAISEAEAGAGAVMSVTRHVKADDTERQISLSEKELEPPLPPPSIQKSATFKDRTARQPPLSPIKLSRVRSQDDLDHQVEEFINKFKEKMRLESMNQYEEMISQGT